MAEDKKKKYKYQFDTDGTVSGPANALLQNFADMASFGLAPSLTARLTSSMYGVPYDEAKQAYEDYRAQLYEDNPKASWLGSGAGLFGGGALLKGAGKALGVEIGSGGRVAKAAQNAIIGGGTAAANDVVDTGEVGTHTATAAGMGALAGMALGPVGEYVAGRAQVLGNAAKNAIGRLAGVEAGTPNLNAWRILAKKVGIEPEVLFKRYGDYINKTQGVAPSLSQLLTQEEAQSLRSVAARAPTLGNSIREAGKDLAANDASEATIRNVTRDAMDRVMSAPGANGVAMRDQMVTIPKEYMTDPLFRDAIRANKAILRSMNESAVQNNGTIRIPLKQADAIRSGLNDLKRDNPSIDYDQMRQRLVGDIDNQVPGYAEVIRNFGEGQAAADAFATGMRGQGRSTIGTTLSPSQEAGYVAGQTTKQGQAAVRAATPAQTPAEENFSPRMGEIGLGMAHVATGHPLLGTAHIVNGSRVATGGVMGTGAAQAVGEGMLSRDPGIVQQTLGRVQAARDSLARSGGVGAATAGAIGSATGQAPGFTGAPQAPETPEDTGAMYYARPRAPAASPSIVQPAVPAQQPEPDDSDTFFYARPRKQK